KENPHKYTHIVPAVDQALKILLYLSKSPNPKVNLTDICKSVGIHKSKGYSILNTLQKYGFVIKEESGKQYSLGPGVLSISRRVLDNMNYNELVSPFLKTLAEKTKSTALFGLINEDSVFVVAKVESEEQIGVTIRIGHRFNLTHGAHGKAIAAFLTEDRLKGLLQQKRLYFYGDISKFDTDRFEKDIIKCREKGYAVDIGELNPGINVIASPTFNAKNEVLGAIFIMGTYEASKIDEYGSLVFENSKSFSLKLGADMDVILKRREG
ncbi:MAG TPA: IclR family transcriptional regulator, partial [Syntrophorhabdaceae bacterium]|nr:IclR family transcriptional regulator [Syntrophorhabdaceae bacterium]